MPGSLPNNPVPPQSKAFTDAIEDILARKGLLTPDQLMFVKNESKRRSEAVEKVISQLGWIPNEELIAAKAQVMGVGYINLEKTPISPEVLAYLPEDVAKRFTAIPISKEAQVLSVAMIDPLDLQALEFLEKKSGLVIKPLIATPESINRAIAEQYTQSLSAEVGEALKEAIPGSAASPIAPTASVSGVLGQAPVARIVSTLLEYGIKIRASDIHIEPLENETRIRFRVDGILHEKLILPRRIHDAIISRIKILSNMRLDEKRKLTKKECLRMRVSTLKSVRKKST